MSCISLHKINHSSQPTKTVRQNIALANYLLPCTIKCLTCFRMYVNCSGPGFALHSDIVMPYISHYGTPEQIEKFIPAMTAGTCIGAIAMTEPSAGR